MQMFTFENSFKNLPKSFFKPREIIKNYPSDKRAFNNINNFYLYYNKLKNGYSNNF